jgi:hypothetical protein
LRGFAPDLRNVILKKRLAFSAGAVHSELGNESAFSELVPYACYGAGFASSAVRLDKFDFVADNQLRCEDSGKALNSAADGD